MIGRPVLHQMSSHFNKDMNRYTIFNMSQKSIAAALFGLLLIVVSCQRENLPASGSEFDNETPIEFSGVTATLNTKGDEGTNSSTLPADFKYFKVWAQNGTNNAVFGSDGTAVTRTDADSPWTYSPVRYWKTGTYNFYAVAPESKATGSLDNSGLTLSFTGGWNLSAESTQTDLLFARTTVIGANQVNKAGGPDKVNLTFDHKLSRISFSARNAAATGITLSVTKVKVYGLNKTAESVLINASGDTTWELETTSTADSPFKTVSHETAVALATGNSVVDGTTVYEYTEICSPFMVFPETGNFVVEVTYNQTIGNTTTSATETATISTARVTGFEYNFKLKATENGITIDDEPSVKPWVSKDSNNNDLVVDDTIVM